MVEMVKAMSRLGTESAFEVLARATALAAQGRDIINLGIGQPALGIGQCRAGRSPPVPTDPPARRAETVTGQGDNDGLRVTQGQIDHGVKIAVDDHGMAKQAV